jgi:hypothetical protein
MDHQGFTAWQTYEFVLIPLIEAMKEFPARYNDGYEALKTLGLRVYNEDFRSLDKYGQATKSKLTNAEIWKFLSGQRDELIRTLPSGQPGHDVMYRIVTTLTATSDPSQHAAYNTWGDEIFAATLSRDEGGGDT